MHSFSLKMKKSLLLILLFFPLIFTSFSAIASDLPSLPGTLLVGIKESPPFAVKNDDGSWEGISIKLWESIADQLNISYSYKELPLDDILSGLKERSLDVGFSALTITAEREKNFDFTHPFYTTGLGIAVKKNEKQGLAEFLNRFFSYNFLKAVSTLILLVGVMGFLLWFFEKDANAEQFGGSPSNGLGSAFWWSAVTMTTVGYGDKAPKTLGGRIVATVWMFIAIIVISSFTAAITSSLTLTGIKPLVRGPEDLARVRVGTITSTTSSEYLDEKHISYQEYNSVLDGLKNVSEGNIDAVVYDAPLLRYLVKNNFDSDLFVLNAVFHKQHYGIAVPTGSPLREKMNQIILKQIVEPQWQDILFHYLGATQS